MKLKPNTITPVVCPKKQFLRVWMEFMLPYHKLAPREMEVAAAFIEKYLDLCEQVPNDVAFRNKCLMSVETQKEICATCNLKLNQLQLYRNKFKKSKFLIEGNQINPKLIPNIKTMENNIYQLLVVFKLQDEPEREIPEDSETDSE